jgi:hypothetical protein
MEMSFHWANIDCINYNIIVLMEHFSLQHLNGQVNEHPATEGVVRREQAARSLMLKRALEVYMPSFVSSYYACC